jgi:hypothetical protein
MLTAVRDAPSRRGREHKATPRTGTLDWAFVAYEPSATVKKSAWRPWLIVRVPFAPA